MVWKFCTIVKRKVGVKRLGMLIHASLVSLSFGLENLSAETNRLLEVRA